jgi:hypothetical protein
MTVADRWLGHVEGTASGRLPDQAVDGDGDEEHQHELADTHELVFIQSRALEGPSPLPKASTKSTGRANRCC